MTGDIDFGRSVLLCSKPLQVLNSASIVRHYGIEDGRLHVLTGPIDDADGFRSFLLGSGHADLFSSISWHADVHAAIDEFTRRPYDSLFVEDDRLSPYLLIEPHRTQRMVLFEEGIGTYRSNPERSLRGLRRLKWKAIAVKTGCGWSFGSGRRTDHVMVSRPDAFRRLNPRLARKVLGFPGLIDELGHERDAWRRAALSALGGPPDRLGRVALVLATWGGTPDEVLANSADGADIAFYKAHPHDGAETAHDGVVRIAESWIPAEALVEALAAISDHLTVYHYSSSVVFYTQGKHANVDYVDLLNNEQLRDVLGALDG